MTLMKPHREMKKRELEVSDDPLDPHFYFIAGYTA